jgi:hypothetical protein
LETLKVTLAVSVEARILSTIIEHLGLRLTSCKMNVVAARAVTEGAARPVLQESYAPKAATPSENTSSTYRLWAARRLQNTKVLEKMPGVRLLLGPYPISLTGPIATAYAAY